MWLKAKNSRQLFITLENLIEGSQYKFRIRAENPYGISDPSEESELIFIPDPKRGLLHPPPIMGEMSKIITRSDENFERKKTKDEKNHIKRQLLEEKAKKLLDTPLSELLLSQNNNNNIDSEMSTESIPVFSGQENLPPIVPRRKNKGKKRLNLNPAVADEDGIDKRAKLNPEHPEDFHDKTDSVGKMHFDDVFDYNNKVDGPKMSYYFQEKQPHALETPLYLRENDDTIMHGSSELMLVLYPRDRSKSVELSKLATH